MNDAQRGPRKAQPRPRGFPAWAFLAALVLTLALIYVFMPEVRGALQAMFGAVRRGDEATIRAWAQQLGVWGPLALLATQLLQVVVAAIPALPVMVVAVLGYGPLWGGLLAWGGLLLACVFGYWIGRTFGAGVVDRFVQPEVQRRVQAFVERYGPWAIVVARLSPLFPADAVSIVAGLSRLSFGRYLLSCALGTLPVTLLLVFLGADLRRLTGVLVIASLVTLAIFAGYVLWDCRGRAKPE